MKKRSIVISGMAGVFVGVLLGLWISLVPTTLSSKENGVLPFIAEDLAAYEDLLVYSKSSGQTALPLKDADSRNKMIGFCMKLEPYRPSRIMEFDREVLLQLRTGDENGVHKYVSFDFFDTSEQLDLSNPNRDRPLIAVTIGGCKEIVDDPTRQYEHYVDYSWFCSLSPADYMEFRDFALSCWVDAYWAEQSF